jgi:PKD repeat protein
MEKGFLLILLFLSPFQISAQQEITEINNPTLNLLEVYVHLANQRNGGLDNIKTLYDSYNEKTLAYFSASAFEVAGASIYIDLADYQSAMNNEEVVTIEGDNGWVTVWIDFNLSGGVGIPISTGIITAKMDGNIHDSKRKLSLTSLSLSAPIIQLSALNSDENGAYSSISNNPNISFSLEAIELEWNMARFEIKKSYLDALILYIQNQNNLANVSINDNDIANIFTSFINSQFKLNGWNSITNFQSVNDLNPIGNVRRFTTLDTDVGREFDGAIYHGRGGYDINDDGIPDNVYPITPSKYIWEPMIWKDFELTFSNLGTEQTKFSVEAKNVPEGWRIRYKGDPGGLDARTDVINDVPPSSLGEFVFSDWEVAVNEDGVGEATLKFELYHNKVSGKDLLDEIDVTFYKYKDGDLFSPQFEFSSPLTNLTVDQGEMVDIKWDVVDPNENSYISLAYDKSLIKQPWLENESNWITRGLEVFSGINEYQWDTENIQPGAYQIWGVVYDGLTDPVYKKLDYRVTINEREKLTANFSSVPETGDAPLTVSFEDLSEPSDNIKSWKWDLTGNGIIDSYEENPTYEYKYAGSYTVSLTTGDGEQEATETKENFISVSDPNSGNDVAVKSILISGKQSQFEAGESIKIFGTIENVGENSANNVSVLFSLKNSDGETVDDETSSISLASGAVSGPINKTLTVPFNASDGSYTAEVRTTWASDGNPDNNFKSKSVYVGEAPIYSQYKINFGGNISEGSSANMGNYDVEVLYVRNDFARVIVSNGSYNSGEKDINIGEWSFFNGNDFVLKYKQRNIDEGGFDYLIPSDDITVNPNTLKIDAGSEGTFKVFTNSSTDDLDPGLGNDMNTVWGWLNKANSNGYNYDIVVDVPLNANRKTYEFWPKINRNYFQVLKIEVQEPRNIRGVSIDVAQDQDLVLGDTLTFTTYFVNDGGYALSDIPIKFKITGPNNYEYTDYDEGAFALKAEKEYTFDWNTAGVPVGEYLVSSEAIVPDDPYDNNSVSTTIVIMSPPVPDPPVLTSPAKDAVAIGLTPSFEWESITGVSSYNLQLSSNEAFTDTLKNIIDISSASYQDFSLNELTNYYWRVRASNEVGYGEWSEIWGFKTEEKPINVPLSPLLSSPDNGAVSQAITPNLVWDSVDNATSYFIELSEDSLFVNNQESKNWVTTGATDYTLTTSEALKYSTKYFWRVKAQNSEGVNSDWSEVWVFITDSETAQANKDLHYINTTGWSYVSGVTIYADDLDYYRFGIINKGEDEVQPGWFAGVILKNLDTEVEYVVAKEEITSSLVMNDTAFVDFEIGYAARGNEIPAGTYAAGFHVDLNDQIEETNEDRFNKYIYKHINFEYVDEKLDEYEPDNNSISDEDAPLISTPFSYQGWINYGWDVDTYAFSAPLNHLIEASFSTPDCSSTCTIILYNQNGEEIDRGGRIEYLSESEERYFILVQGEVDSTDYERQSSYDLNITTTENEPIILLGDVTGNGAISPLDASAILKHTAQLTPTYPLAGRDSTAADVTCDGGISHWDALEILKHSVDIRTDLSCNGEAMAKTSPSATTSWELIFKDPVQKFVEIPVSISGNDIYAFSATLYLPDLVEVESVSGIPENWISIQNKNGNKFLVSAIGTSPINDKGGGKITFLLKYGEIKEATEIKGYVTINDEPAKSLQALELIDLPTEVTLSQNYPNPFNPATRISFSIPEETEVRLEVFNMLGKRVATLADGNKKPGAYTVSWNASSVTSGVYVYRLATDSKVLTNKMMLIK